MRSAWLAVRCGWIIGCGTCRTGRSSTFGRFHPMLRTVPGDRIVLPASCRTVQTEVCSAAAAGQRGDRLGLARAFGGIGPARFDLVGRAGR